MVGTSYCTYAPDYKCFSKGWPSCCSSNGNSCPRDQPDCDVDDDDTPTASPTQLVLGSSYCTWSSDYDCYENGWPECCERDPSSCPKVQPRCDDLDGASYCTFSPDYSCYMEGWPSCCLTKGNTCPHEEPACDVPTSSPTTSPTEIPSEDDITGNSYCTWSPDYDCYKTGWPACCDGDDSSFCPKVQPTCDNMVGASYCTYSPNTSCYSNGWPSCCSADGNTCPREQPTCEVSGRRLRGRV